MNLEKKIINIKAKIAIVGLGYVGLPLAYAFLEKKFQVIGIDLDKDKTINLSKGINTLKHLKLKNLKKYIKEKKFKIENDFKKIKEVDVIILCVPTPLNKFREPDLSYIINSAKEISKYLKKDQLVILESSTFPGTTDENLSNELEKSGLKANIDFSLSYSPEREDPGNKEFNTTSIPKIIGADSLKSKKLSKLLYESIIDKVVVVSSAKVAEAAKLTENIFRSVNIALVNELKVIYDPMGIDVWEVIEAASTKPFGYMPFYPGPGLGGHCIPIDPFYLTYKAKEFDISTKFIELAGEINTSMPTYVVEKVIIGLSEFLKKSINSSKILVIGLAYKSDIDDMRESPAVALINLLMKKKANVSYHDDLIKNIPSHKKYGKSSGMKSKKLTKKFILSQDAILIVTKHSLLDLNLIAQNSKLIIDTRNAMKNIKTKAKIIKA